MSGRVLSDAELEQRRDNAAAQRARNATRDAKIAAAPGSLREIGARFGVSYEIVRRIKDRARENAA